MTNFPDSIRHQIPNVILQKLSSMDALAQETFLTEFKRRKKSATLCWWILLPLGCHYAYVGKWWLSLIFWFTFGGFGIWWFIDLFRTVGMVREFNRGVALKIFQEIQVLR